MNYEPLNRSADYTVIKVGILGAVQLLSRK